MGGAETQARSSTGHLHRCRQRQGFKAIESRIENRVSEIIERRTCVGIFRLVGDQWIDAGRHLEVHISNNHMTG